MKKQLYPIFFLPLVCIACEKFLDVGNPQDQIVARYVYESNTSAAAAMTGVYYDMVQEGCFTQGQSGVSIACGAAADELRIYPNSGLREFYTNNVGVVGGGGFWSSIYRIIYRVNAIIDGLNGSVNLSNDVKRHLIGEAKFIRAFCYFYLVNMYGDVPLLTSADYRENQSKPRTTSSIVYNYILRDLNDSEQLLSDRYLSSDVISETDERLRPNKWTAKALIARVHLFLGNWKNALDASDGVINNTSLYDTVGLNEVFLKNSKESIWQLQPIYDNPNMQYYGTFDGRVFILESGPNEKENPAWLSRFLLNSFELTDNRLKSWVKQYKSGAQVYYFPFKYRQSEPNGDISEYLTVIRLSEVYLIRSEAKCRLGDLDGAEKDLNIVRMRAGLKPIINSNQNNLIEIILRERQVELFTEWGHRWFDLKRLKLIDKAMMEIAGEKEMKWASYKAFFPLPDRDIRLNPSLRQNNGY